MLPIILRCYVRRLFHYFFWRGILEDHVKIMVVLTKWLIFPQAQISLSHHFHQRIRKQKIKGLKSNNRNPKLMHHTWSCCLLLGCYDLWVIITIKTQFHLLSESMRQSLGLGDWLANKWPVRSLPGGRKYVESGEFMMDGCLYSARYTSFF